MNPVVGVLRMHYKDRITSYFIPSLTLMSSFIVNLIIGLLVAEPIYTGGIASIYVYYFVAGIFNVIASFPFALGFSVRRKDFFWGTAVSAILTSAAVSVLLWVMGIVEHALDGWGTDLHFFHLPYVNDGNLLEQYLVYAMPLLNAFAAGFVIASIWRRFGRNGMYLFAIVALAAVTIFGYLFSMLHLWSGIWARMIAQTAFGYALWMIPLTVVYLILSYMMLRKAAI